MFDSPQVVHELLVSLFRCHQRKIEWEREVTGEGRNERRREKGGPRGTRDDGRREELEEPRDDGRRKEREEPRDDGRREELEEREMAGKGRSSRNESVMEQSRRFN